MASSLAWFQVPVASSAQVVFADQGILNGLGPFGIDLLLAAGPH